MDGHPRVSARPRDRTRLTDRLADASIDSRRPRSRSIRPSSRQIGGPGPIRNRSQSGQRRQSVAARQLSRRLVQAQAHLDLAAEDEDGPQSDESGPTAIAATGRASHAPISPWLPSILVGPEDVRGDASVADGHRGFEVAQGDRDLAIREQALHVVHALALDLDIDQAAERAALDAMRGEVNASAEGGTTGSCSAMGGSDLVPRGRSNASDRLLDGEASTAPLVTARRERY